MIHAAVTLPADLSEAAFTTWVVDLAMLCGWRVQHIRPARTAASWRTPVQGHAGGPDLLLARHGVVLGAELKTRRGRLRPDQRAWLDHLGPSGRLWRPVDAPTIHHQLTQETP